MQDWIQYNPLTDTYDTRDRTKVSAMLVDGASTFADIINIADLREKQRLSKAITTMPEYTEAQKAAAFDLLWKSYGNCKGVLQDYVTVDVTRPGSDTNNVTMLRIPKYRFYLVATGEFFDFAQVLHTLVLEASKS